MIMIGSTHDRIIIDALLFPNDFDSFLEILFEHTECQFFSILFSNVKISNFNVSLIPSFICYIIFEMIISFPMYHVINCDYNSVFGTIFSLHDIRRVIIINLQAKIFSQMINGLQLVYGIANHMYVIFHVNFAGDLLQNIRMWQAIYALRYLKMYLFPRFIYFFENIIDKNFRITLHLN